MCTNPLNPYLTVGPADPMRKFFWWIKRDKAGQRRIEEAHAKTRELGEQITSEIVEEKERAGWFRSMRQKNHLGELFDAEFGRGKS